MLAFSGVAGPRHSYPFFGGLLALALAFAPCDGAADEVPLTLAAAESLALQLDPGRTRLEQTQLALRESALSEDSLPDPQILFGPMNLPVDTFDFDQEPMTQLVLGYRQQFRPGRSRAVSREHLESLADAQDGAISDRRRMIVREVHRLWLERFFLERAGGIVDEEFGWFVQLEGALTAAYAAGGRRQHDIIRVQLEKELLREQRIELSSEALALAGALERWLGADARRPLPQDLPAIAAGDRAGEGAGDSGNLGQHPLLQADRTLVEAGRLEESLVRERLKPVWGFDVRYGLRDGEDARGDDRADFFSAMLTVQLPLFSGDSNDSRLAAASARTRSMRERETERRRELEGALATWRARYAKLRELEALYKADVLPAARANVEATMRAYELGTALFDELVAAQKSLLDIRTKQLRLAVNRKTAAAELQYLVGDTP